MDLHIFYFPAITLSYSASCLQKPSFGLAQGCAFFTREKAFSKDNVFVYIRNAVATVEDLDIPALLKIHT
jgi:hypothetical protein